MDVVGKTCTIILSGRGKVLHNVPFIGPSPTVGDSVVVNYTSGRPIVEAGAKAIISTTASASLARPAATPAEGGRSSYHNDLKGIQGGADAGLSDPAEYYHLTAAQVAALGGGPGGAGLPVAQGAGTVDAITANFTPDVTLADLVTVVVIATGANTSTTPSFAPDGLTAHTIVKKGGVALAAGDIPGEHAAIMLEYNLSHTRWELLNPSSAGGHIILDPDASIMPTEPNLQFTGGVTVTDDPGNNKTIIDIPEVITTNYHIDQSGGTSDSYGVLAGDRDGANVEFIVSEALYLTGTLTVYRNGQLLTQGSGEDWHEHDPSTGKLHFTIAPLATDEITVVYATTEVISGISGSIEEAPDNYTSYVRKNLGWVPEGIGFIDQTGGTGDTHGIVTPAPNGAITDFTTGQAGYISGTLRVFLNGVLQVQGTAEDWKELVPANGTFRMNIAPEATDEITITYTYSASITVVGGQHIIQEEGGNLTARSKLNFVGANITASDDAGNDTTIVTAKPLVIHSQIIFTIEGVYLTSGDQGLKPLRFRMPYVGAGATIEEVFIQLDTAPSAANLRVDIHKNGTSIFSATNYVEITVGSIYASKTTDLASGGACAKDNYFQIELVQGDSTAANLSVHLRFKWTLTDL